MYIPTTSISKQPAITFVQRKKVRLVFDRFTMPDHYKNEVITFLEQLSKQLIKVHIDGSESS